MFSFDLFINRIYKTISMNFICVRTRQGGRAMDGLIVFSFPGNPAFSKKILKKTLKAK